jgi:ceramide glucosyltransferase
VDKFDDLPGVTILKPLKGVDDNLMENLTTFFNIDYPYYELIFCIQDENDPAIDVVKRLMAKYPIIDTKLFYGKKVTKNNIIKYFNISYFNII